MKLQHWFGQATTGAGFATILAAFSGMASGSLTWQHAIPLLLGGVAGMAWPENPGLSGSAETAASDLLSLLTAYRNMAGGEGAVGTENQTLPTTGGK